MILSNKTSKLSLSFYKKVISRFIFLLLFIIFLYPCFSQSHPATDDEFVGPFLSWINVKTQFGAVGDGVADETAALQAAFNAIGNSASTSSVVYLPAGIYRITGTLTMNSKMNVSVIGADPSTTKIVWAGAAGGTMFQVHGTAYSRFNRITWDGRSVASVGIDQSRESASQGYFDTGNEYADDEFTNVGIGIRGGHFGYGFAEIAIMRCKFTSNTTAGITLGNFNALDVWVWHSVFENCAVGITNNNTTSSAGNFKVYNSIFRNSTTSDIVIGNTGEFAFRDNTSTNSNAFLKTINKTYPCHITLQSNTIIDPVDTAISIHNQGPIILLDNIIRSRGGAIVPVVYHSAPGFTTSDFFSLGNTFTLSNAINATGRKIIYDNPVVTSASLIGLREQILPGTQPNLNRTILEVPSGSDAIAIQNIIYQAALLKGTRPIVHFSHGTYNINQTLHIPSGSDMQIVGDGHGDLYPTWLWWTGGSGGSVINVAGPSKVTFRDISINGNNLVSDILMTNMDQAGSRVFMHQMEANLNANGLLVNGLDNASIIAYNSRVSQTSDKAISVVGGPLAAAGTPQAGKTIIYGGLLWENILSNKVTNGGNLLVRDVWYESGNNGQYLNVPGRAIVTVEGSSVASPRSTAIPQVGISNLNGKVSLVNSYFEDRVAISGDGSQTKFLALGSLFGNNQLPINSISITNCIENTTSPAGDIRSFNSRSFNNPTGTFPRTGSYQLSDVGTVEQAFLTNMLEQLRGVHSEVLAPKPDNVTDVRMYRVWLYKGLQAIELQAISPTSSYYFRTKQNGNWNDVNIWESSPDNAVWNASTVAPDYHANTITISNGHTVTLTADTTIDQTIINPTGALILTGSTLTVTNRFTNDGLTLQSNATGTARIGTSTGFLTGNVIVERYNSNKRAWRLLGIPYISSDKTIYQTWMESKGITPGFGTQITTFTGDPNTANFDGVQPASSIRIYTSNSFTSDAAHTPNTLNLITANSAYFLFVRGDRAVDRTTVGSPSTTTVLRTAGVINQGALTAGVPGAAYSLIPNPYPSPIDFDAIKAIAANSSINTYYVWDASLGTTGNYRTITVTGSSPNYTYTSTPSAGTPDANNNWRFIESGSAFFVAGNTTVSFTEAVKSSGIPPSSMLRTAAVAGNETQLVINLYTINANNTANLADGIREIFGKSFDAGINTEDAKKVFGFELNLGIISNNNTLSVEKRPLPKKDDVINLKLWNNLPGNYRFEVLPANFPGVLTPYLKDNFLNTQTEINQTGATIINFTVSTDAASKAADRFSIVFSKPDAVKGKLVVAKSSIVIYPNPVNIGIVTLRFDNMPEGVYNVDLISATGQKTVSTQINHSGESNTQTLNVRNIRGVYLLEITKPDKSKETSKIIIN